MASTRIFSSALPLVVTLVAVLAGSVPSAPFAARFAVTSVTPREAANLVRRHQGRARLVFLYSSTCPACRDVLSEFVEIAERYQERNVSILTFSTDETVDDLEAYLDEVRFPFRTVLIRDGEPGDLDKAMKPTGIELGESFAIPFVAVLDPDGDVVGQTSGTSGVARAAEWLDSIADDS